MRWSTRAILVVDDEPDICWALSEILKGMSFRTITAGTGEEAIRLALRSRFRLAFVDAKLPDPDGIDLAKRLREMQPKLPIVLVSGYYYDDDSGVRRLVEDGVIAGFISKPFLLEAVRKAALLAR